MFSPFSVELLRGGVTIWGRQGRGWWLSWSFGGDVAGVQLTRCRNDMGEMGIDKRSPIGRMPTTPSLTSTSTPEEVWLQYTIERVRITYETVGDH